MSLRIAKLAFGVSERSDFYKLMYSFTKDRIPVHDALLDLREEAKHVTVLPAKIIDFLCDSMRGIGKERALSIGESLSKIVDPIEATLIESGERSGQLANGFKEAGALLDSKLRLRRKLRSELAGPVGLLFMLFGLLWLISTQMVPVMDEVMPRARWPFYAKVLGHVADHVTLLIFLMVGVIAGFLVFFTTSIKTWVGSGRDFFDSHVAPWTTYRAIQSSMTLNSVAMMIGAGVPIADAIKQLAAIGSPWQIEHYARMQLRLQHGATEAEAVVGRRGETGLFDARTAFMVRMYGQRTSIAESMKSLASEVTQLMEDKVSAQFRAMRLTLYLFVASMAIASYASFVSVTLAVSGGVGKF